VQIFFQPFSPLWIHVSGVENKWNEKDLITFRGQESARRESKKIAFIAFFLW